MHYNSIHSNILQERDCFTIFCSKYIIDTILFLHMFVLNISSIYDGVYSRHLHYFWKPANVYHIHYPGNQSHQTAIETANTEALNASDFFYTLMYCNSKPKGTA